MLDPAPSSQFDVFVSYRRADAAAADALTKLLELFGRKVFLDLRIPLGQSWDDAIRHAARGVSTLCVLWSRNAAASTYMKSEWRMVPATAQVVPVLLDGSPLPPELEGFQAMTGLQAHERLLARSAEITRKQGKSPQEALTLLLEELKADGIDLTQEQRRALLAYLRAVGKAGLLAALASLFTYFMRRAPHAASSKAAMVTAAAFLSFGGGYAFAHREVSALDSSVQECQTQLTATNAALDEEAGSSKRKEKTCKNRLDNVNGQIATVRKELASCQEQVNVLKSPNTVDYGGFAAPRNRAPQIH